MGSREPFGELRRLRHAGRQCPLHRPDRQPADPVRPGELRRSQRLRPAEGTDVDADAARHARASPLARRPPHDGRFQQGIRGPHGHGRHRPDQRRAGRAAGRSDGAIPPVRARIVLSAESVPKRGRHAPQRERDGPREPVHGQSDGGADGVPDRPHRRQPAMRLVPCPAVRRRGRQAGRDQPRRSHGGRGRALQRQRGRIAAQRPQGASPAQHVREVRAALRELHESERSAGRPEDELRLHPRRIDP